MTSKEKTKFRTSSLWKDFRKRILYERNYQCEICGIISKTGLNLHHLDEKHYGILKKEKFLLLCRRDHKLLEQLLSRKNFDIDNYVDNLKEAYEETKKYGGMYDN